MILRLLFTTIALLATTLTALSEPSGKEQVKTSNIYDIYPSSPKTEIRAVWLTTIGGIDWPHSYYSSQQKEELSRTLDQLKKAGINTVFLQTRVRGTTIYPSALEPWDGCLSGKPGKSPGYDALQLAIDECHKRGMQLHAWIVTIPVGKWNKLGCQQLRQKYPKLIKHIGEDGYMDPENPTTAQYLARFCKEVVSQYDVDGIHLDYIRYPETWRFKVSRAEGRRHITRIVSAIYQAVKEEKPWVMLSCSPIGKHDNLTRYSSGGWNARTAVCQDAQEWLRTGLMDALFPMMYFQGNQFYPFAIDWKEHSYGRIVVPGLGIYFLDPREGRWTLPMITRQMYVLRDIGMGHCYFRSKFLTDNTQGIYDFACKFDQTPALIPPMTWASKRAPEAPNQLQLEGNRLMWSEGRDRSNGNYLLYNVYASKTYPVDITKAENLMATRLREQSIYVPDDGSYYAVTAQDRYGLESEAIQLPGATTGQTYYTSNRHRIKRTLPIIRTNGKTVLMPDLHATLDAEYIIIETLQGQQVSIRPYKGRTLNIAGLPDGIYMMRSLGKKGRNHRIGLFTIKRKQSSK